MQILINYSMATLFLTLNIVSIGCTQRKDDGLLKDSTIGTKLIDPKLEQSILSSKNLNEWTQNSAISEYQSNAIIMTLSESIQNASTEFPRVILFSNDTKTMVSYESLPLNENSQQLEIIQYNAEKSEYEFFEAQLGVQTKIHNMTGNENCSTCHHGAPIWEPYDFWPGAMPRASICLNDIEEKYFQSTSLKSNALLAKLNLGCKTSNNLKLADGLRNNHHFTYVSKRIQRIKNFERLKYSFAAAMMDCPDIATFNEGLEGHDTSRYSTIREEAEASLKKMDKDMYDLMVRDSQGVSTDVAVGLAYLLIDQGLEFRDLFMSFKSQYFITPLQGQILTLLRSFMTIDPILSDLPLYRVWKGNNSELFGINDERKFRDAKKQSDDIEKIYFGEWQIMEYFADANRWKNIEKHNGVKKACDTLRTLSKASVLGQGAPSKVQQYQSWIDAGTR
jgi:hypothetical protein